MARSIWKGPYIPEYVLDKVRVALELKKDGKYAAPIRAPRNCDIIPAFIGLTFKVHNGRNMIEISIKEDMVSHKMGEFAPTRTFRGHTGDKRR